MQGKKCRKNFIVSASVIFFLVFLLQASVLAQDTASELAKHFLAKTAASDLDGTITVDEAMKIQAQYVSIISEKYGPVIGYKAGLTNEGVQKNFGVSHPLRGTLLKNMLRKSGTVMKADFGPRPLSEGDLILRVKDEGINTATTPRETLNHISEAIPFIELPDLLFEKGVKIDGPKLAAVNVAARYGVVGTPIQIQPTQKWFERLEKFQLQILDEKGTVLAEGTGSSILGHPLNVVLWIKDSLNAEGIQLKKGDLLSLGTITKLMPTQPNTTIRAKYIGLDPRGPVEISVKFK
ncbi:MAG TPA: hydratase [Deltaproteobacteria bacterium]|nr:hydratase [Deltaproteobacteria bacterium]